MYKLEENGEMIQLWKKENWRDNNNINYKLDNGKWKGLGYSKTVSSCFESQQSKCSISLKIRTLSFSTIRQ